MMNKPELNPARNHGPAKGGRASGVGVFANNFHDSTSTEGSLSSRPARVVETHKMVSFHDSLSTDGSGASSMGSTVSRPRVARRGFLPSSASSSTTSGGKVPQKKKMSAGSIPEVTEETPGKPTNLKISRFRKKDMGGSGDNKDSLSVVIQEFLCPLSKELPIDPVAAEDGYTYDREAIQKWIEGKKRDDLLSPATGQEMGPKVFPATQVKKAIERAVRSRAIAGKEVERWKKRVENEEEMEDMRKRASNGEADAMYMLGVWYQCGKRGIKRNVSKAYEWYARSADGGNVRGMAAMGFLLVKGEGTAQNQVEGMALITFAACEQGGVDAAAYCLGLWYSEGMNGLPKSPKWAIFWLKKVVDGTCSIRDMDKMGLEKAGKLLDELREKFQPERW